MKKRALIVDVGRCINCNNCVLASRDECGVGQISIERHTRGSGSMVDVTYVPMMCNHCDDAPCVRAARDGSIYKREDGLVIVDPQKAKGRRDLVAACPYGAISWNEAENLPQNWAFDAHLLDQGWKAPRCVQACPTGALESVQVSDDELRALAARQGLEELRPELATRPRVLYRNFARVRTSFVSGNVVGAGSSGRIENIQGAQVSVAIAGAGVHQAITDAFGEFKIDGLRADGAAFELSIRHQGFGDVQTRGKLNGSVELGSLELPVRYN